MRTLQRTALSVIILLTLAACAGQMGSAFSPDSGKDDQKTPTQTSFDRFPDLPMPAKVEMDKGKTLIFGVNDEWIGRLVIYPSHGPNDMFDFYKQEMIGFGWKEITSVRSDNSVMTYTRAQRVASIQINDATFGSKVTIIVSPKGAEEFPTPTVEGTVPPPSQ